MVGTAAGSDARPLHRRIADDLRARIAAGEFAPGDPLPSEPDLVRSYGASRGTIRQARAALRAEGIIAGSQGKPLSVQASSLTQPLGRLLSFTAWIENLGRVPSGRVLALREEPADADTAPLLGVAPGASVVLLERVRLADDEPLMIERTRFPIDLADALAGADLEHGSVYAALARRGVSVLAATHRLDAVAAPAADAALLGIRRGSPLLRVRRRGFAADGRALECSDDRYRGDRVDFELSNGSAAGLARRLSVSQEVA